jgi:hypothetical protein
MSGRIKHMERSHRSYGDNKAIFKYFDVMAYAIKSQKQAKKYTEKSSVLSRIKALFRRQER